MLKGLLEADATLMGMLNGGVYLRSVPTNVATPIVKIDRQDASDLTVVGMHRVWSELTYLVRGIARYNDDPDWTTVGAIADRIENVLQEATTSSATATIYCVRRLEPFTDETTEGGNYYLHAGGIYELYSQAL